MNTSPRFLLAALQYAKGMREYRAGEWHTSKAHFAKALEFRADFAAAQFKIGMCHFRQEEWQEAFDAMQAAIELDPSKTQWTVQRDQSLSYLESVAPTSPAREEALLQARIAAGDSTAQTHAKLADNFRRQGRPWQEIEALQKAIDLEPENVDILFKLGDALDRMRRYKQSADVFSRASALRPANATYAYRAGFAYERDGFDGPPDLGKAKEAYGRAIATDKSGMSAKFGIGNFHQSRGLWPFAAAAYEQQLKRDPNNAELLYRLGLAYDRQFLWEKAEECISRSVILDSAHSNRLARLGFVLERQGKFLEAAATYGAAADLGGKQAPDRRYRQGFALTQAGAFTEAGEAFIKMRGNSLASEESEELQISSFASDLANRSITELSQILRSDATSPDHHFALGKAYEVLGKWKSAADCYRSAIARRDTHNPDWYYRLGQSLLMADSPEEAANAFVETRRFALADGWIPKGKLKGEAALRRASYAEYYERLPVQEKTVLFESFHGRSMSCNPMAIFRHLLTRDEFSDWTHIWVLDDHGKIPPEFRSLSNVVFLSRQSDGYMRALATAKVLINNSTFPVDFIRKTDQIYLNTWHGTPIKTLGKFISANIVDRANTARNFLQATHLLSPNGHTSEVLVDHYDIGGLYAGEIAETGYPRIDVTINKSQYSQDRLRDRLGARPEQKIALYAPTFRGSFGDAELDTEKLEADLKAMVHDGYHLLFRGHYETERMIRNLSLPCTIVPEEIDSNSLLSVVDLLISDYSSIVIDFLPRRKPIIYYAYDLDEYEGDRGLYFPLNELPGQIVLQKEDLQEAIRTSANRLDFGAQEAAIQRFCPMEDGCVCQRVVDWVFRGDVTGVSILPKSKGSDILVYPGSMTPNGITASFLNLAANIDHDVHDMTCLLDGDVSQYDDRLQRIKQLPEHLKLLARVGARLFSPEELWVESKLDTQHFISKPMERILAKAYTRELRRELGPLKVSAMVNFDGYARFFQRLFAFAQETTAENKLIYMHNDMHGEWREKYPYLQGAFGLFSNYNKLISVSETLRDLNCEKLSGIFHIHPQKFGFAENMHNPSYVRSSAEVEIASEDERVLFDNASVSFLTMGRMSLEKDQAKLIRAFRTVCDQIPNARLFHLGDGPLRPSLEKLIKMLRLSNNVFLLGQKPNPFPYVKRADCFVLPSNHEGQPMVLIEALILNRPIIATDIHGNRGALAGRPGTLVENSEAGLAEAMLAFAREPKANAPFDIDEYQRNALDQFLAVLDLDSQKPQNSINIEIS